MWAEAAVGAGAGAIAGTRLAHACIVAACALFSSSSSSSSPSAMDTSEDDDEEEDALRRCCWSLETCCFCLGKYESATGMYVGLCSGDNTERAVSSSTSCARRSKTDESGSAREMAESAAGVGGVWMKLVSDSDTDSREEEYVELLLLLLSDERRRSRRCSICIGAGDARDCAYGW